MLQFFKENPFTLESKSLFDYERTFMRAQDRAINNESFCTIFSPTSSCKDFKLTLKDLTLYRVIIMRQGSFTSATILNMDEEVESIGISKRNNDADADNPKKGEHVAVRRAIENLFIEKMVDLDTPNFTVTRLDDEEMSDGDDGTYEVTREATMDEEQEVRERRQLLNDIPMNPEA